MGAFHKEFPDRSLFEETALNPRAPQTFATRPSTGGSLPRLRRLHCLDLAESAPMGFLKKFCRNVYHETAPAPPAGAFESLTEDELEAHLGVSRYGSFVLSDAVRPSFALDVVPSAGFRHDKYRDEQTRQNVP